MGKNTNKAKEDTKLKELKKRGRKAKKEIKEVAKPIIIKFEYSTESNPLIIEFKNLE
jgi:hypothetical protein